MDISRAAVAAGMVAAAYALSIVGSDFAHALALWTPLSVLEKCAPVAEKEYQACFDHGMAKLPESERNEFDAQKKLGADETKKEKSETKNPLYQPPDLFQNEPDGFRGIKWGAPFSTVQDQMTLVEHGLPGELFYERSGDHMVLGGVPLDQVQYEFYRGIFYGAYITSNRGVDIPPAMKAVFSAQFGEAKKFQQPKGSYNWNGPVSGVSLSCDLSKNECTALLESTRVNAKHDADLMLATARKKAATLPLKPALADCLNKSASCGF